MGAGGGAVGDPRLGVLTGDAGGEEELPADRHQSGGVGDGARRAGGDLGDALCVFHTGGAPAFTGFDVVRHTSRPKLGWRAVKTMPLPKATIDFGSLPIAPTEMSRSRRVPPGVPSVSQGSTPVDAVVPEKKTVLRSAVSVRPRASASAVSRRALRNTPFTSIVRRQSSPPAARNRNLPFETISISPQIAQLAGQPATRTVPKGVPSVRHRPRLAESPSTMK